MIGHMNKEFNKALACTSVLSPAPIITPLEEEKSERSGKLISALLQVERFIFTYWTSHSASHDREEELQISMRQDRVIPLNPFWGPRSIYRHLHKSHYSQFWSEGYRQSRGYRRPYSFECHPGGDPRVQRRDYWLYSDNHRSRKHSFCRLNGRHQRNFPLYNWSNHHHVNFSHWRSECCHPFRNGSDHYPIVDLHRPHHHQGHDRNWGFRCDWRNHHEIWHHVE